MDCRARADRVVEPRAAAIDEHEHMLAQLALLIEHVVAHLRLRAEHGLERRADRRAADFAFGAAHVALQVGREHDARHGEPVS